MIFGALSLHPKFRSQQPGFEREVGPQFRLLGRFNWDLGPARQLFWIEAKCVELPNITKTTSIEGITLEEFPKYPLLNARLKGFRHCAGQPAEALMGENLLARRARRAFPPVY